MTEPSVSIIIASRMRPKALQRCLTAISQLVYTNFEVVVVGDDTCVAAANDMSFAECIKIVPFNEANVAKARNAGIAQAAGEICAFIDDDAVPEPTWLNHLSAVFSNKKVMAAGGYVRGRNGISFQSKAGLIDAEARELDMPVQGCDPVVLPLQDGMAIKTPGTNCAFRTATLLKVGGFDPSFVYYLDESELNFRISKMGGLTAIVPKAQVHHGYLDSERRLHRIPLSLASVGISTAIYLRKHSKPDVRHVRLDELLEEQRNILIDRMVAGQCEPRDVTRLMATLQDGIKDGLTCKLHKNPSLKSSGATFRQFFTRPSFSGHKVFLGKSKEFEQLKRKVAETIDSGSRVTLLTFGCSALFHRVSFEMPGYWLQKGGMFGKSVRRQPMLQWIRFDGRAKKEIRRFAEVRGLDEYLDPIRDETTN